MNATERINALKEAGIDVSNLFAMKNADGREMLARIDNMNVSILAENDPIFSAIKEEGVVPNKDLFRRWVMSQVFHMMIQKDWKTGATIGFHEAIKRKGFKYSWKMVADEMSTQYKMSKNGDYENLKLRSRWFDKDVVCLMLFDYIKQLEAHISSLKVKHCKGVGYKTIGGNNIFISDIHKKVVKPLRDCLSELERDINPMYVAGYVNTAADLILNTWTGAEMSKEFIDAYKGAGAYFTMKNLILFHDCNVYNRGKYLSKSDSIKKLDEEAMTAQGWEMFGMLKDLLKFNNIDIEGKIASWRKK